MKRTVATFLIAVLAVSTASASHGGGPTVALADNHAGRVTTWTFTLDWDPDGCAINCPGWGANGQANITFPAAFSLPPEGDIAATITAGGQNDGSPQVTVSGQTVIVNRGTTPATAADGSTVVISLNGIINAARDTDGTDAITVRMDDGAGSAHTESFTGPVISAGNIPVAIAAAHNVGRARTDYTFTFSPFSSIPLGGSIEVNFPSGYTQLGDLANATADGDPGVTVTKPADGRLVIRPANAIPAGGDYILRVPGVVNKAVDETGSAGAFVVTTKDSAGGVFEINNTASLTLIKELAQISVSPSTRTAGATATLRFDFQPNIVPLSDVEAINVTLPAGFSAGSVQAALNGASVAATKAGQTISLDVQGMSGPSHSVTITNISLAPFSGPSGKFQFTLLDAQWKALQSNQTLQMNLEPGALSNVVISKTDARQNAPSGYTVEFNHTNPLPNGGKVRLVFPSGYTVQQGGDTVSITSFQAQGRYTATGFQARNPDKSGTTGPFTVETLDTQGRVIDRHTGQTVSVNAPVPLPAGNLTVTLPATHTYATGQTSIKFGPTTTVPAGGSVIFRFPSGYALNAGGTSAGTGDPDAGGTVTIDAANRTATLRVGTTPLVSGDTYHFNITRTRTPAQAAAPALFQLDTLADNGARLDRATAPSPAIAPAALTNLNVTADSRIVDTVTKYTFTFNTPVTWPADGRVNITMDGGFLTEAATATMSGPGLTGSLNVSVNGNTLVLQRQGGGVWVAGPKTLVVSGLVNPVESGNLTDFTLNFHGAGAHLMKGSVTPAPILEEPDSTPPAGRPVVTSLTHTNGAKTALARVELQWTRSTDAQSPVEYHYLVTRNETGIVTRDHPATADNETTVTLDQAGIWYIHVRPASDGGLGNQANAFVVNLVRIDQQEISRVIELTKVKVVPMDGGNRVTWTLPSDMELSPLGQQLWRARGADYTLIATLDGSARTYDDTTGGADGKATYLVTPFWGRTSELGFYGPGESPDPARFQGVAVDDSRPLWTWVVLALLVILIVVAVVVAVVLLVRRLSKKKGEDEAEGLVDLGVMAPGEQGYGRISNVWGPEGALEAEQDPDAGSTGGQEHQVSCPACDHVFHLTGSLPLEARCPHCGVTGTLE